MREGGGYNYYLSIYCREWNLYQLIDMECLTFMGHKITSLGMGVRGGGGRRRGSAWEYTVSTHSSN